MYVSACIRECGRGCRIGKVFVIKDMWVIVGIRV